MDPLLMIIMAGALCMVLLLAVISYLVPIKLWIAGAMSGAYIPLLTLVRMRLRREPVETIINSLINATQAGVDVSREQLEALWLSGGNVMQVVNALIAANKVGLPLTFDHARAMNLAGHDVFQAVRFKIEPKAEGLSYSSRDLTALEALENILAN